MSGPFLLVLVIALSCIAIGVLVHVWFGKAERESVLIEKADEYVNDTIQAAKARAESGIEKLSDQDVLKEFEDKFGGPK